MIMYKKQKYDSITNIVSVFSWIQSFLEKLPRRATKFPGKVLSWKCPQSNSPGALLSAVDKYRSTDTTMGMKLFYQGAKTPRARWNYENFYYLESEFLISSSLWRIQKLRDLPNLPKGNPNHGVQSFQLHFIYSNNEFIHWFIDSFIK